MSVLVELYVKSKHRQLLNNYLKDEKWKLKMVLAEQTLHFQLFILTKRIQKQQATGDGLVQNIRSQQEIRKRLTC